MTYFCPWFRGFRCLYKADIELESVNNVGIHSGEDPGFVGPEAHTILGVVFKKKKYKITNKKLGMKVNIYLE